MVLMASVGLDLLTHALRRTAWQMAQSARRLWSAPPQIMRRQVVTERIRRKRSCFSVYG